MSDPNEKQKCEACNGSGVVPSDTIAGMTHDCPDCAPRGGATAPLDGSAAEVKPDTGHAEADRVIGRLASSDPDFDDCTDAAVLIRQLVVEHRGPDGFATWKDAAVAERLKARDAASRVAELERALRCYGQHHSNCKSWLHVGTPGNYECTCGLRTALSKGAQKENSNEVRRGEP